MVEKAKRYGYTNVGFILDRGTALRLAVDLIIELWRDFCLSKVFDIGEKWLKFGM